VVWTQGRRAGRALALSVAIGALAGCHAIPFEGDIRADARVNGAVNGTFEVKIPPAIDPGPVIAVVVRPGAGGPQAPRIALVDVDGLILDQNQVGLLGPGENPVSGFREKLEACARDPRVRAVVLRINSPGGSVAASDTLAEELRRFRVVTGKPVVACLMGLAAGGGYYLAVGADLVEATPNGVVGGVGALFNRTYNLSLAASTYNVGLESIKSGDLVDLGTVKDRKEGEPDRAREMLQEMVEGYADRFRARVAALRPAMTASDREAVFDGRVMAGPKALALHAVDKLGYLDDALADAEALIGPCGAEVVMFQRAGLPIHSIYSVAPVAPSPSELLPLSVPGLDRSKLPTFLYLWQPDPTLVKTSGR
jgi:protease IV